MLPVVDTNDQFQGQMKGDIIFEI
uniref:Uncharacterized protein n=1 Tax=Rhizophora mucronata TaxID=61149 RepID=A0A2P2LMF7_RHIMU